MNISSRALILLAALTSITTAAQEPSDGQVYIVPVDASGASMEDAMTEMVRVDDNTFSASAVNIDYGFWIQGLDPQSGLNTHFGLPSWAVKPAVIGWLNPLSGAGGSYIAIKQSAAYDISFHSRQDTDYRLSMVDIKYSGSEEGTSYPDAIYLVPSSGTKIKIEGTDGVYTAEVALPASFKVAYEPNYSYEAFIFGPASSKGVLEKGVASELQYGMNTGSTFSYPSATGLDADGKIKITVDLASAIKTIMVGEPTPTGTDDLIVAADDRITHIYDASGRRIDSRDTTRPGLYIVRTASGHTSKMLVR